MTDTFFFIRFTLADGTQLPLLGPYLDLEYAINVMEQSGQLVVKTYLSVPNGIFIPSSLAVKCIAVVEEHLPTIETGWVVIAEKVSMEF